MMTDVELENKLLKDVAKSLGVDDAGVMPADLTDKQLDAVFNLANGTTAVKRCRGDFPLPSYKIGRSRRTPLFSVIEHKLNQLKAT